MAQLKNNKRILLNLALMMIVILAVLIPFDLPGRPGGGSSFGGGGGGGGSYGGGGGGGGDGIGALVWLVIRYPHIGIPLLIVIALYYYYTNKNKPQGTISSSASLENLRAHTHSVNMKLQQLNHVDPNFSKTLFLDFAQHLFYQFQHVRGKKEIWNLSPYFQQAIIEHEQKKQNLDLTVTELVIGNIHIVNYQESETDQFITMDIEANYTETIKGHTNRLYVKDQWIFSRQKGVLSKGPEDMFNLHCPNCGSHLELKPSGACHQCDMVVTPGKQHWQVGMIRHIRREAQKGKQFGTYAAERGTDLPTIFDPNLQQAGIRFGQIHNIPNFEAYAAEVRNNVVRPVFMKIYQSWSDNDYKPARPLMSDNLFRSHHYWIEAYKKAGLNNKLDNIGIKQVLLVKLDLDKYYEAMTVRIFASCNDYLIDSSGKVIGGSKTSRREFSEYWTFIRRAGVEKKEEEFNPDQCPNCGAPVDMGMTGECSYCHSKVTTGDFGWVLSMITQDEVYYG